MSRRKVILLELNEINWPVVDKLISQHGPDYLPNFRRLRERGSWATQVAVERPPYLDPWITWVTLHTGVPREVHGASVLEQDAVTITAACSGSPASAETSRRPGNCSSIRQSSSPSCSIGYATSWR